MRVSGPLLTLLAALAAGEAVALSCAPPSIERSFNWWADAEERYYIAVGTLTASGPLPRVPDAGEMSFGGKERPDLKAEYRLQGYLLDGRDNVSVDTTITVEVGCAGPWCGRFPSDGTSGLMALEVENSFDMTLGIGACPGTIFDASVEAVVTECMRAGRCPEQQ